MNKEQIEALSLFIKDKGIDTVELYDFLNTVRPGDFHFTNGTHFPFLVPGLTPDGVFANEEFYLTDNERTKGETTQSRAERYCLHHGCFLPDRTARDIMIAHREEINASLKMIRFPLLKDGEYWAVNDPAGGGKLGENLYGGLEPWDNIYTPGTWRTFHKYVRGCMKVLKEPKKVNYTRSETDNECVTVLDGILKDFGVSRYSFERYRNNKSSYPEPGHYLLKSGEESAFSVYDQEAGIFINANWYIKLDLPKDPFTLEQTRVYLKAYEAQLPEYFALRQIAKARTEINNALTAVGMQDFLLPENVLEECWCKESLDMAFQNDETGNAEQKRVLPVGYQHNVDDKCLLLDDIWEHLCAD